jgi:hypothetical protein
VNIGRVLVVAGALLIVAGLLFLAAERLGIRLGRLPGDITLRGRHTVFYFPLATCILISVILSLIFWLLRRR